MYPELKENRPHGTDNYPYTQYHMHNIFHAFQIPVHWHDELEVIYTKKGPLNLLIDGKEYTAEDGSVYFSVSKVPNYGKLAHLDREILRAGTRVANDEVEKEG